MPSTHMYLSPPCFNVSTPVSMLECAGPCKHIHLPRTLPRSNRPVSTSDITAIVGQFMQFIARPARPITFHTDDNRLRQAFRYLGTVLGVNPQPSILPEVAPSDPSVRAKWLEALSMPEFQGCGHIRHMISNETSALYSVGLAGSNVTDCPADSDPSNCISSAAVAAEVIRQWYRCVNDSHKPDWWFHCPCNGPR